MSRNNTLGGINLRGIIGFNILILVIYAFFRYNTGRVHKKFLCVRFLRNEHFASSEA